MSQLDDLFKQAREIPVNYSLEETLSVLESNTGAVFPRSSRFGKWLFVITSYSIHYTKLYE